MKTIKYLIACFSLVWSINSFAQTSTATKTAEIKTEVLSVSGNCEMCKARIEKAAKIQGVIKADWVVKTKKLTLTYHSSKVKSSEVQKSIAAAGHDTPKFKATDKTYDALPGCCKYR